MWRREILNYTEIITSLPPSTFPSTTSFLLRISVSSPRPSSTSSHPVFCIPYPPASSLFLSPRPITAFTLSYYPSLYSTSLALSLSLSESCRQTRRHALMLLYLTRHAHTLFCHMHSCTLIWERGRGGEGTGALRRTGCGLSAGITNIAKHGEGVMHDASKPIMFLLFISLSFSLRHTLTPLRHTAAHEPGSGTALDVSFIQRKDQKERINSLQSSPSKDLIPSSLLVFL